MCLQSTPTPIPLILGSVCGPVFGIFDLTGVQCDGNCHLQRLEEVPLGLIEVSQVLMIFKPDQLREHARNRECTRSTCPFAGIDAHNIPPVDFICRAWFPNKFGESSAWFEASISISGAMVATEYIRRRRQNDFESCELAFWCELTGTWEKLKAKAGEENDTHSSGDTYATVVIDREDFSPPASVTYSSSECADLGLEEEAIKVQQIFNDALSSITTPSNCRFLVAVFSSSDLYTEMQSLPKEPQLVPFIPLFMGELQHIVVTGHFLRRIILRKYRKELQSASLKPYAGLILDILRGENPQRVLEYFPIQQQLFEGRPKYPMEGIHCGWTFFRDISEESATDVVPKFPRRFFTIEPGFPVLPPFGNSASGALACAIVQSFLYSSQVDERYYFRGETNDANRPWGESINRWNYSLEQKRLRIWRNSNGKWVVSGLVRIYGCFGYRL